MDIANYEARFEATSLTRAAPPSITFDAAVPGTAAIRTAILTNPLSYNDGILATTNRNAG